MAENYWIKLYMEILDDRKMAKLPDNLWRLVIELFLLAGKEHRDGALPPVEDIAWMLRRTEQEVIADMTELTATGIIDKTENSWIVAKFSERQAPSTNADRAKRFREAKQKEQYYSDGERNANENRTKTERSVTQKQITDTDTDTDTEPELIPAAPEIPPEPKFIRQFCDILGVQFKNNEQANDLHELFETYGADHLLEVAAWASDKQPNNMGHALAMVRKAASTWKIKQPKEKSFAERLAEA